LQKSELRFCPLEVMGWMVDLIVSIAIKVIREEANGLDIAHPFGTERQAIQLRGLRGTWLSLNNLWYTRRQF
jgi:hypothetical protein